MSDERLIAELVDEVVRRLATEEVWGGLQSCQTVCMERDGNHVRYIVECGAERLGCRPRAASVDYKLASFIDHTLLRANATQEEVEKLCREAAKYGFASVCVNPIWVRHAVAQLSRFTPRVCTVVGFPLGANTTDVKAFEARRAIFDGAEEIDMVLNVGALRGKQTAAVREDIRAVVGVCHEAEAVCKVILETAFLTEEEKVTACLLSKEAEADFVKTSTGFGPSGATPDDVALMRKAVGPALGVKAAGGIKNSHETREMLAAGATRIGASASVRIIRKADNNTLQEATGRPGNRVRPQGGLKTG